MLYLPYEIWRDIPWYEWYYKVSNLWNIYSFRKKWLLKERITIWYAYVALSKNFIRKEYRNSRLVAQSFLWLDIEFTDAKTSMCVCHKDDNPRNNNVNNLFLWTNRDNVIDKIKKWRWNYNSWEKHPMYWKEWPLKWKFWKEHHLSKPIYQITLHWDIIWEYEWIRDAWRKTWINCWDISKVCKWKSKTAWWYIWSYVGNPDVSEHTRVNHIKTYY